MLKKQDAVQPRGRRHIRFAMFAWGTTLLAVGSTSCAIVGDDIAVAAEKKIVVVEAPHVAKAYAYPADRAERPAKTTIDIAAYHGSAPYICSPSGFGQKSRCFARPSL